jgi:hypothetical protein
VARQLIWLAIVGLGGLVCKDSGGMKGYTQPLRVVERTQMHLARLQEKVAADDYRPVEEPAIGGSEELIHEILPYSLKNKMADGSTKQEALAKLAELQKVFDEQVKAPAYADPPDLAKVRPGVAESLKLLGELKKILGG